MRGSPSGSRRTHSSTPSDDRSRRDQRAAPREIEDAVAASHDTHKYRGLGGLCVQSTVDIATQAVPEFIQLLKKRLDGNVFTTEDSVRYTFFAALMHHGVTPDQVVLEAPYRTIPRAKLDTLIYNSPPSPPIAIEFKYTRALPGGGAVPRPMLAGMLFADLGRLLLWPDPVIRYFIYVTGREMHRYLTIPSTHGSFSRTTLAPIFTTLQADGEPHDVGVASFAGVPATFSKHLGAWPGAATITVLAHEALPQEHYVWVFRIARKGST